jgi:aminopeptidase N
VPSVGEVSPTNQHYALDLTWQARQRALSGTEQIGFTNATSHDLTRVWLRLWPNGQSGCGHPFLTARAVSGGSSGPLAVGCTALPVTLTKPLPSGGTATLRLRFSARVPAKWNFRFGVSGDASLLGNAIPILALTDARGERLEPYVLQGESFYSASAAWDVRLRVPRGLTAATTGSVKSRSTLRDGSQVLGISAPAARDFALAIGRFRVFTTTRDGVRIRYFQQGKPAVGARTILSWASRAIRAYTRWYGALTPPELDVVGTRFSDPDSAQEYPGLVMTNPLPDTLQHEIAHQWFYAMVGDNQYAEPWLDESFTEFSNRRLSGTLSKCDTKHPFAGLPSTARLDDDLGRLARRGVYIRMVYDAGPCVLEHLRRDWGDRRFDAMVAGLVSTFRNGIETTPDVVAAIRKWAPPGFDVEAFLQYARLLG